MKPLQPVHARLYCLDWIRVLAFGLLLFYHIALIFVDSNFHVKNQELYAGLQLPMFFIRQWRMPLLFLISGAGSWFALKNINGLSFLKERFVRLFIPLTFGFLVIVPPLNYIGSLQQPEASGTYFYFLRDHFLHHFRWNHLWFIAYLMVYSIIALPLFLYLRGDGKKWSESFSRFFSSNRFSLLLLVIPLFIVEFTLRDAWPDKRKLVSDWYNFLFYFITLVYGYFVASNRSLWDRIEADRTFYFILGVVCFIFIYTEMSQAGGDFIDKPHTLSATYKLIKCIDAVSWMLCFLGYAKRYLNFNSFWLQYANRAVYPFYILHYPILIGIGYVVVRLDYSIFTKYILIALGSLKGIGCIYEGLIRRSKWIALVFGVKERDLILKQREPGNIVLTFEDVA